MNLKITNVAMAQLSLNEFEIGVDEFFNSNYIPKYEALIRELDVSARVKVEMPYGKFFVERTE